MFRVSCAPLRHCSHTPDSPDCHSPPDCTGSHLCQRIVRHHLHLFPPVPTELLDIHNLVLADRFQILFRHLIDCLISLIYGKQPETNTGTKVKITIMLKYYSLSSSFCTSPSFVLSFHPNERPFFKYKHILSQKYFSHTIKCKLRKHFYCQKKNSPHIFYVKTVLTVHVQLL